jgi:very-short-patch-repair endonuclease
MDVRLRDLAAGQADVVACWQLLAAGWTPRMVDRRLRDRGWRAVHSGVHALTSAPLTRRQRWIAATLTTPDSVLSYASAGACWGFRPFEATFETVTRPGSGGRRRLGGVLVFRSKTLDGDTTWHDGIRITTAARTLIDLALHVDARATRRAFREAIRLKATTTERLLAILSRHRGRPGTRLIADLVAHYSSVPYPRTRSDAESRALELLLDAGVQAPRANRSVAGEEADLVWPERRLIIEIDGPQYHRFPDEDARKQRLWEAAGYTVRRIGSQAIYDQPAKLIALARRG